jgi:hypothetical protein
MFRFDRLIRRDMTMRDVKQSHPGTIPVFERFGFHRVCDDCNLALVARKNDVEIADLLDALNLAAFEEALDTQAEVANPR